MKVTIHRGRGKGRTRTYRPVRVHQHCNDWATVDFLDEEGGSGAVSVTDLVMESAEDLEVFRPDTQNNGTLWDEFQIKASGEPPDRWVFIPKGLRPVPPGARRRRRPA